MAVFKCKDRDGYKYKFQHKGKPYQGYYATRKEATDGEASKRTELKSGRKTADNDDGTVSSPPSPTFTDWAGVFLADRRKKLEEKGWPKKRIDNDIEKRKHKLTVVLRFFGSKPTDDEKRINRNTKVKDIRPYHNLTLLDPIIEPQWIDDFEAHMHARGLAGQSRNNMRSTVSLLYRHAMKPVYRKIANVPINPFRDLERNTARHRTKTATPDELRRIIAEAAPHLALALFIGIYAFELRVGSILALTWDNIDQDFERITVTQYKTVGAHDGEPQVIPIPSPLRRILKAAYESRNPRCNRVVQYRGIGIDTIDTAVRAACERAGVEYGVERGVTFHTLRHTMNTEAARLGFEPKVRQLLSGHKTMAMTDRYTHLSGHDKKKPLEKLARHMERQIGVVIF